MRDYSLTHLRDAALLRSLAALVSSDRLRLAELLAHIAEVDARKLYAPAGHSSMHAYCVDELRLSEGAAFKRIRAARAARDFPELLPAIADGRLHLAAVCLLAPYLTRENVAALTEAATHRRKSEIEVYLARMFPLAEASAQRMSSEAVIRPISSPRRRPEGDIRDDLFSRSTIPSEPALEPGPAGEMEPVAHAGQVGATAGEAFGADRKELSPGTATPRGFTEESASGVTDSPQASGDRKAAVALSPGTVPPQGPNSTASDRRTPLPERYLLKLILDRETHDRLRYAQTLLSHAVPTGDVAQVLRRALDALIPQLEKRKFGGTTKKRLPRPPVRLSTANRHIPTYIRGAVWERDQARCTFVGTNGKQCRAKRRLEFDHVDPHVREPEVSVEGLRLRCRAHNQLEAERIFGAEFMAKKRQEAKGADDGGSAGNESSSPTASGEGQVRERAHGTPYHDRAPAHPHVMAVAAVPARSSP